MAELTIVATVVGIVVSPLIDGVIDKLVFPELIKLATREGLDTVIQKLKNTFEDIQTVVADAEDKQISNGAVKNWLEDLQHLAYDADDVLDEFATEGLRRKLMAESKSSTSMAQRLFTPTFGTGFRSTIRSKIKEINRQLEDINARRSKLPLVVVTTVGNISTNVRQRPPTTCFMVEPRIYGRDEEMKQIIELLLKDAPTENKVDVIPIVGMGGIGKTTMAQHVYNDDRLKDHFNLKAWVCVSDQFEVTRITKAILESFTRQPCNLGNLNDVQGALEKTLAGKKFLLVLDDVWNDTSHEWYLLRSPFGAGAHGSKIIVTTRGREVAMRMATVELHNLQILSDDECWSIFAHHAFGNFNNVSDHQELASIGRKIVTKCGGLPLAASALGGLLRFKQEEHEWEAVLNSNIWNSAYEKSGILPALKLSYHHLPSHLKKCFEFCAIIPKDHEFEEEELVLLWMAEGLLTNTEGKRQMEDLGSEYFEELVSRSLFQTSSGNKSSFIMHDLINDLAQAVAGDLCFRLENNLEGCKQNNISKKARHSSYVASWLDGIKKFETFKDARCLRTFLQFWPTSLYTSYITRYLLHDLLPNLKRLRELRLCSLEIYELPDSIGDLEHLRYLNVSHSMIRRLPDSVVRLLNLQVLLVKFCEELQKLPPSMGNLGKLRHLDMTGAKFPSVGEMPLQISKLTNLQTLSHFMVGEDSGRRIRELGKLSHIRGAISISRLEKVNVAEDAREANLSSKQRLKELSLEWEVQGNGKVQRNDKAVLEMLRPHELLEQLTIKGYGSTTFPSWVGDASFSKMESLRLENCTWCTSLPPLGQLPSLKHLHIEGMRAIKQVGCEFFGKDCAKPFPLLESLHFVHMPKWKDWSTSGADKGVQPYSLVNVLSIQNCPKLVERLPNDLPCLKSLEIKGCPQLLVDVSSLVLPSLTSFSMEHVPIQSRPANLEARNTLELGSLRDSKVADEIVVLPKAMCGHLTSITSLSIQDFGKLVFLPEWLTQGLMTLEELKIESGKELVTLWQNEVGLQHCLPTLRQLEIQKCPKLVSLFEEEEEDEEEGRGGKQLSCIMRLEQLIIEGCEMLKKLPRGLHTLTSLGELDIWDCPSLVSFPKTGLPSMLRKLYIYKCDALQSLGELMTLNNLEVLKVTYCSSLTYLSSRGGLPSTLKSLDIWGCEKLESLLAEEGMKINCPSLESIVIRNCGNLKCLPDALHSNLMRNLSSLQISECDNLESLPEGWFHPTTNLRELKIRGCEKLEALPLRAHDDNNNCLLTSLEELELWSCHAEIVSYFLKGGSFLTNLTSLTIEVKEVSHCQKQLPAPSEWGLHRLSSLRELSLRGPGTLMDAFVSFTKDGMLPLPTSLIRLTIEDFPNLERLSYKEFENLASLERLEIFYCPRFKSFPKEGLPPSLLHLHIIECPELASFPKQGLPPSLLELGIWRCPKLKRRCEKGKGKYWQNIAYIPRVLIV